MTLSAQIAVQLGTLDLHADVDVKPGELLALLGPNGAGKSTVLRCLAGLEPIERGRIVVDDVVVDDPETDTFVEPDKRSVGFVFQNYLLFEHMSVLENVAFGLRARKTPRADARRCALQWLDRVGLAAYADTPPRTLSGGQAQRAALARALAPNPRLLLLDEPLAALDAGTRSSMRRDLLNHLETFDGMRILVTHDPVDAYALADRVAILEGGSIVQTGTLAEVTAHPRSRYVADLIGINLVAGTITGGIMTTASGAHIVIADALPGPSFAVIHPHSIALVRQPPVGSSARNMWQGSIVDIHRLGDRARVTIEGALPLTAEVTSAAVEALQLRPGDDVYATVKATDIQAHPA